MNTITTTIGVGLAIAAITALVKLKITQYQKIKRIKAENTELRDKIRKVNRQKRIAYKIATTAQAAVEEAPTPTPSSEEAPAPASPIEEDKRQLIAEINAWRLKHAELAGAYYYVPLKTINGKTHHVRVSSN